MSSQFEELDVNIEQNPHIDDDLYEAEDIGYSEFLPAQQPIEEQDEEEFENEDSPEEIEEEKKVEQQQI